MKNSTQYGARLKKLLASLQRELGKIVEPEPLDPLSEMLLACLSATTTEAKAHTALVKLRNAFVDDNELRVARPDEITEVLGKTYPQARDVAVHLTTLLKSVYDKTDELNLDNLKDGGKREAKAFLDGLDGATPYVTARVMMRSLGAHAFPVHPHLQLALEAEEAVAENADAADVQGFLERHVPASKIHNTYALLRHYSDNFKAPKKAVTNKVAKKKTKKATKKTAKKKKSE